MKSPLTPWNTDEIALITALWGTMPAWKIGQQLHRPPNAIRCKAQRLHLPRITAEMRHQFRWLTDQEHPYVSPDYVSPAEKKIGNDEENQRWIAYWRSRHQERIQRIEQYGEPV